MLLSIVINVENILLGGNIVSQEMQRTYVPFKDWKEKSAQTEYTESTPLLASDGTLLAKGWARHNVFDYDRTRVKAGAISKKEWDFRFPTATLCFSSALPISLSEAMWPQSFST